MEEKFLKKYVMYVLLTITLVLGACSNTKETASEASTDTETSVKQEPSTQNAIEETGIQKEQKETTGVQDLFDIQLNAELNTVELMQPGGKPVVLADSESSKPVKSPNGEKAAYISPWGWEEFSDLVIVDLQDGSQNVLVSTVSENQPKDVIWEDNEHVLVIIGYQYGTVVWGGDIYRINVETHERELVAKFDEDTQITHLLRIEDDVLYYSGIQYTDDIQNEYKEYSNQMILKTESIQEKKDSEATLEKEGVKEQEEVVEYTTYQNGRFGFSVEYPTSFTMAPPPSNDDGRKFHNEEFSIVASGSFINILEQNETIETYYQQALANAPAPVTLQRLSDNGYTISYIDGSNIFYEKAIINDGVIVTLQMTYPSNQKKKYDGIVTRISNSFKAG